MSVSIDYTGGVFKANRAKSVGTVTAGTETYDIANASYDSVSFSVQTQDSAPQDLTFKSDGTKMYVIGAANDNIYQYSLSTAWDLSTASYDSVSFSVASQEISPSDVFFKPDGSKFYICGFANDTVFQYSMSTAWDISTASYDSISFSVATQEDNPRGIVFKPDGTKLFVIGNGSDAVQEYSLSTAWDLSTASHSSSFSVSSQETAPQGLFFHPDGDKFWITGNSDKVWQYSLSTAWDVSTASYSSLNFSTTGQMGIPVGVEFKSDGTKMYLIDNQSSQYIYQYSTGTATTLDLSTGNYFSHTPSVNTVFAFNNPPASGTAAGFALALTGANVGSSYDIANASYDNKSVVVSGQTGVGVSGLFFKPDGSTVYASSYGNDVIHQFTLSVNWDISTATNSGKSLSVASQENDPRDFYFTSDGYTVFLIGTQNKTVYKYTLTTAWDISTASYANVSFSVLSQTNFPRGITFKTDGTEMYIADDTNDAVDQYSLSTAFDISTASYTGTTGSISTGGFFYPSSVRFKPDGTGFFIANNGGDDIDEHSLSTPWDVTTSSYVRSFYVNAQTTVPQGLAFSADGTKMYTTDTQRIYQYSTGSVSPATITYSSSVKFASGTAPVSPAIDETDVLVFYTDDGGTTYQGFKAGDAMA